MNKLLRAGIRRYLTSKVYWSVVVATLFFGWLTSSESELSSMDSSSVIIEFALFAILASWNIGREYEEGIFRNKIIAGHTKAKIFISELILAIGACMSLFVMFTILFAVGNTYVFKIMPTDAMIKSYILMILINIAMVTIFVTISSIMSHRALSITFSLILLFAMYWSTLEIGQKLIEEKYIYVCENEWVVEYDQYGMVSNEYSQIIPGTEKKVYNRDYVGGWKRKWYQFIYHAFPTGALIDNMNVYFDYLGYQNYVYNYKLRVEAGTYVKEPIYKEYDDKMNKNIIYNLGVIIFMTASGCILFSKTDFK